MKTEPTPTLAAVARHDLFGSWMPIETAPKDSYILLCLGRRDWAIGCWNRNIFDEKTRSMGVWVRDDGSESERFFMEPTHWMNLPPLPPRFDSVTCSQCGNDFGPGNHGFSNCADHSLPNVHALAQSGGEQTEPKESNS